MLWTFCARFPLRWILVVVLSLVSSTSQGLAEENLAGSLEQTFQRSQGWTGADGTYSISLGPGQTLWGFSDTFFGEVVDGRRAEPFRFVNNSLVHQRGEDFTFLKAPVFTPPDKNGWFWLFDGVKEDDLEILLGQFEKFGEGAFGFRQSGLWWARFVLTPGTFEPRVLEYAKLPFFEAENGVLVTFGSALLQTPTWTYVYGIREQDGQRSALVARVPRGLLGQPGAWRFFNGDEWVTEISRARPLFSGASVEYSVHQGRSGEFVYLSNDEGGMSSRIVVRRAPTPSGPWGEPETIAMAPEHEGEVFAYNAKAHPEASPSDALLVSYNVNTTNLERVVEDANIYRPRFLLWKPSNSGLLPVRR